MFVLYIASAAALTAAVDLGITDDQVYKRPNASGSIYPPRSRDHMIYAGTHEVASRPGVSVAWRNANQDRGSGSRCNE
jgi:hypothetical protein